jgi:hypothetical protein
LGRAQPGPARGAGDDHGDGESDHLHQLWLDTTPQSLIGKAPFPDANCVNEERAFGLPRMFVRGHEGLAAHHLREALDEGLDLALFERNDPEPLGDQPERARLLAGHHLPSPDITT